MFRFVHASDLHLGAAFQGIRALSRDASEALQSATYRALEQIVRIALEEKAALVVLAGDLCNRADGSLKAELALRKAARQLHEAGIAVLIVYGNHDYLSPGRPDLDWPPTTRVFPFSSAEPWRGTVAGGQEVFVFGRSYGRADEGSNLAASYPEPPAGVFSIGLLHAACGQVTDHAAYAPCTLEDLRQKRYDYWALGHVHTRNVLQAQGPAVVYPGNPQGLNPKETGPRGCYVISVSDDAYVNLEFRETDAVRWFIEQVDIGQLAREQELIDALEQRLAGIAASLEGQRQGLVRFTAGGRGKLHKLLSDPRQVAHLHDHLLETVPRLAAPVWTESIVIRTRPDVNIEQRRQAEDFVGDFLRIAEEIGAKDDSLDAAWAEIIKTLTREHEQTLEELGIDPGQVPSEVKRERLTDAEYLGVDLLLGTEG